MPLHRDETVAVVLALTIAVATVVLANTLPTRRVEPSAPASVDADPTCAEWTDGCIVCQRTDQGLSCSTAGAACIRKDAQCLTRDGV